jgi:hypothetical protein
MKEHRFSLPFTSFGREHCISRRARSRVPAPCPCHSRGSGLGGISAPAHGRRNPPPPLLGAPGKSARPDARRAAGSRAPGPPPRAVRSRGRPPRPGPLAPGHRARTPRCGARPNPSPRRSPPAMRPGRTMRPRSSASTCAHTILLLYLLRLRLRSLEREGSQEPASVMKHGRSRCLPLVNLLELY